MNKGPLAKPNGNQRKLFKEALAVLLCYSLVYLVFFSPVLFSNRLLAPGDGIIYFLPNFAAPRVLWETMIWGGFPSVGDTQLMLWYPPALLFSLFGAVGYQPFLLAAYVLASSFTYAYSLTLTRSRLAAAISGCVYGLGGFLVAHVGHASLVHSAAWLPLLIWALAMMQRKTSGRIWFVVAALAVAACALAGHPQIFVYSLCLGTAFVLITGWQAEVGCLRYFLSSLVAVGLGVGIAAVQLWPTSELASLSWRAALSFQESVAYEMPLRQLPMLVFPYLYGGSPGSFYGSPYFGAWPSSADGWGAGELTGYVGLITLVFAAAGFIVQRRSTQARFWLGAAAIALLLTLGESTPLAQLVYHLPVLNKFRSPARHFVELTFSLSVLAGFGVSAVQQHAVNGRSIKLLILGAAAGFLVCLASLFVFAGKINELALQRIGQPVNLKPWANPAVAVPLLILLAACAVIFYWQHAPNSRVRTVLLVGVVLIDLASFGWFYEWHYRSPYKAYLQAPAAMQPYRAELEKQQQRILPVRGGTGRVSELPPNLSKLWRIPSASGYGPFILTRLSRLLTMPPHGSVDESWRDPASQRLALMTVRYLIVPPDEVVLTTTDARGTRWATSDFSVDLGPGCNPKNPTNFIVDLPPATHATSIALVGALACSVHIPDGQEVLTLVLTDGSGASLEYGLRAGRDFSEWAYDCPDVKPMMQHRRAEVFRTYPTQRDPVNCEGHYYVSRVRLNPQRLGTDGFVPQRLELRWSGLAGTFALKKITLINDQTASSTPVSPLAASLGESTRWRKVGEINATNSGYGAEVKSEDIGASVVFENLRARPRAWLVFELVRSSTDEAFNAIRTSRLPDGRAFDVARQALVEAPLTLNGQVDSNTKVEIVGLRARETVVRTSSIGRAFLVTSDVYYPGWRATIDDVPASVYQTDYALRGVMIPSGTHEVRFQFTSSRFFYGAMVSLVSFILLIGFSLKFGSWRLNPRKIDEVQ